MSKQHDEITRLLDGKMTGTERCQFLQELDKNHPEEWRTLALGFVEHQLITDALHSRKSEQLLAAVPIKQSSSWNIAWLGGLAAALILGLLLGTFQFGGNTQTAEEPTTTSTQEQLPPSIVSARNTALTRAVQPLEALNSALKQQGHTPKIRRGYIEAQMADGRRVIVPISQLAVSKNQKINNSH